MTSPPTPIDRPPPPWRPRLARNNRTDYCRLAADRRRSGGDAMSTPIYFTCGAFVCSSDGDAHELVTCIFDARKTSRRRAKQLVARLAREGFPVSTKPAFYMFKGVPCDVSVESAQVMP